MLILIIENKYCDVGEWFSHYADTVGSSERRGFESHRHNMKKEINIIKILAEAGVSKEVTLQIMYELLNRSSHYADNLENIDSLLKQKLNIDEYISIQQYVKIDP